MRLIYCDRCGVKVKIQVNRDVGRSDVSNKFRTVSLKLGKRKYEDLCFPCFEEFQLATQEATREAQLLKERLIKDKITQWGSAKPDPRDVIKSEDE